MTIKDHADKGLFRNQTHGSRKTTMKLSSELKKKYLTLQHILRGYGRLAIAFSGGVDSSLLLKIAHDTLGENILALFADSVVQSEDERQSAIDTARALGTSLEIVAFTPLSLPDFVANTKTRCYHCKKSIFSAFIELASQRGFPLLADGTNVDDLSQDRPGAVAVAELGVKSPLAESGLTKGEIRQLSKTLELPTWKKPSASCLATRIPTGIPITAVDLTLVDKAERYLHGLGYHGCRVRLAGTTCYLEVVTGDIARLASRGELGVVHSYLCALGATKVFLDLLERESILS